MAAAECQVRCREWKTAILHAIVYLDSKFDLKTLSCRQKGRLYQSLRRTIETSGFLIRTKSIVSIV